MEIEAEPGAPAAEGVVNRREDRGNRGVPVENCCKTILDHHADLEIRAMVLQQLNGGRGQHAIAQRAQADNGYTRIPGKGKLIANPNAPLFVHGSDTVIPCVYSWPPSLPLRCRSRSLPTSRPASWPTE